VTVTGGDGSKLYKYMYYKYQHEINQSRFNGWWTSLAWRIAAHGKILTPPRKNETPWIWGNSVTGFGQPHPKRDISGWHVHQISKKTNTQKKQKIQTTTILLWTLWAISCSEKKKLPNPRDPRHSNERGHPPRLGSNLHHLDVPGRKLGSMVRINGLFHPLINGVFLGVITHWS